MSQSACPLTPVEPGSANSPLPPAERRRDAGEPQQGWHRRRRIRPCLSAASQRDHLLDRLRLAPCGRLALDATRILFAVRRGSAYRYLTGACRNGGGFSRRFAAPGLLAKPCRRALSGTVCLFDAAAIDAPVAVDFDHLVARHDGAGIALDEDALDQPPV